MANQSNMAVKPRQQRLFLFQKKTKTAGSHALWKARAKTRASSLV